MKTTKEGQMAIVKIEISDDGVTRASAIMETGDDSYSVSGSSVTTSDDDALLDAIHRVVEQFTAKKAG